MNPLGSGARFEASVQDFASALKNLTIYPQDHPRVQARAAGFLERLRTLGVDAIELTLQRGELCCNDQPVASEHLAVLWLAQRCRETGLRGVRVLANARPDDVVAFANALIACRKGSGQALVDTWDDTIDQLLPMPLVLDEVRAEGDAGPHTEGNAHPNTSREQQLAAALREVAQQPTVRSLVRAIEAADHEGNGPGEMIDLVGAIAELLPVDAPHDAPSLRHLIEGILGSTLNELRELTQPDARVRGAELMRTAMQVARRFFARPASIVRPDAPPPSGRPEDEGITADRAQLLDEYEQLPVAQRLRLPPASTFAADGRGAAIELAGVYLHGITRRDTPLAADRRRGLAELLRRRPECRNLLAAYLAGDSETAPAARAELLGTLLEHDLLDVVRDGDYVDEPLLCACFPESLSLAARTLRDSDGRDLVRRALQHLAQTLGLRTLEARAADTQLTRPPVVELLLRTGGPVAMALLTRCDTRRREVRDALLRGLQELEQVPELERATLRAVTPAAIPDAFLRRLLRSLGEGRTDPVLRQTAAGLLRTHIGEHRRNQPLPLLLPAIRALRHAPCPESRQLLRSLARGGLASFSPRKRAIRKDARLTLASLDVDHPETC